MTKRVRLLVGFTCLALLTMLVACGCDDNSNNGGGGTSPKVVHKPQSVAGSLPGMHASVAKKTTKTSFNFGIVEFAYAQTSSTAIDQSWYAVCDSSPSLGAPGSVLLYRLGQFTDSSCSKSYFVDSSGQVAADNANAGQLIIGAGTLQQFVAYTSKGTVIVSQGGVPVHLWVKRGGQTVDTNIVCNLAASSDYITCSSGATFAVQNNDLVVGTMVVGPGDVISGLNVVFTKVLP